MKLGGVRVIATQRGVTLGRAMRMFGVGAVGLVCISTAVTGCTGSSRPKPSAANSATSDASFRTTPSPGEKANTSPGEKPNADPAVGGVPIQQRAVVRTATLNIRSSDVDRTAADITGIVRQKQGRVDGDNRQATGVARTADLVLRVPPEVLDPLITQVVAMGTETSRAVHGEDVTANKADTEARVAALTTSVSRLRNFLAHSGSIGDLIALEGQLSQREAELESAKAQQRALADQVGYATLSVHLSASNPSATAAHHTRGFGSALLASWHAIAAGSRWLLVMGGYVLPIAVPFALIGMVIVRIRRSRRSLPGPIPDDETAIRGSA
jgi:hypothetical protein